MGNSNTQADLKTSTPDSIKCKEELESIKHTLDNLDEIAEQNSNLNLTAEQLFTYKKQIDDIEEQLNSLTERHSISERSDMTNLYEKQVELFRHVYTLQKDVGDAIEATIHPPTVSICHELRWSEQKIPLQTFVWLGCCTDQDQVRTVAAWRNLPLSFEAGFQDLEKWPSLLQVVRRSDSSN